MCENGTDCNVVSFLCFVDGKTEVGVQLCIESHRSFFCGKARCHTNKHF